MQKLDLSWQYLTDLPVLSEDLRILNVSGNRLTKLPKLPPNLEVLNCSDNYLTELPPLPKTLKRLLCKKNYITKLPELPYSLKTLKAGRNRLTSVDLSKFKFLETLELDENQLTKLSKLPSKIINFSCRNNAIRKVVNFPEFCQNFDVGHNLLTSEYLRFIPSGCQNFKCDFNPLTSFPKFQGNSNLKSTTLRFVKADHCQFGNSDSLRDLRSLRSLRSLKYLQLGSEFDSINIVPKYIDLKLEGPKGSDSDLKVLTIPKGTVLFRGINGSPFSDFFGAYNSILDPKHYHLYPNYNVFFYPYPFAADVLSDFSQMVLYVVNHDVKVNIGSNDFESSQNRSDLPKIESSQFWCKDLPISDTFPGRSYDKCYTEKFLKEHPEILGYMGMNSTDAERFIEMEISNQHAHIRSFFTYFQDSEGNIGVPEIALYPLRKRVDKEILTPVDRDGKPIGFDLKDLYDEDKYTYSLFYTSKHKRFSKDTFYSDIVKMLSPEGLEVEIVKGVKRQIRLIYDSKTHFLKLKV